MAQLAAISSNDSETTAKHLLDELDSLEDKTCGHCQYLKDCDTQCGDVRIFENMRKEIHELANHPY